MQPGRIRKLNDTVVAQIAAGEVVESPAAVIKELVENSIDAKSTSIEIFIHGEGFDSIQVRDNGLGIYKEDLSLAVDSFATSKVKAADDLFNIYSLGFRGEALGSIRSVSQLSIESKPQDQQTAARIEASAGQIQKPEACALPGGTRILVENLFFNTPIRKEFQKNKTALKKQIIELVTDLALSYHEISFTLVYDGKEIINTPVAESLTSRIEQLFSAEVRNSLMPVYFEENKFITEGYISNFGFYKSNAGQIRFFVNRRRVEYRRLVGLFKKAYGELMPPGRFPVAFLFVDVPPELIDVNVHPQKKEIRFRKEHEVYSLISKSIAASIEGRGPLRMRNLRHKHQPLLKVSDEKHDNELQPDSSPGFSIPLEFEEADNAQREYRLESRKRLEHENAETTFDFFKKYFPQVTHARLYKTFILASSDEGVFLIDQHTAHERINYEQFLKRLEQNKDNRQNLLAPVKLNLTIAEKTLVSDQQRKLEDLGFTLEDLGPAGLALTAVPYYIQSGEEEKAWHSALKILEEDKEISSVKLFDQMAKNLSCAHAIKKGDDESVANLQELVNRLSSCETPGRCPHGRPTIVFLGKDEIFSLFKRNPR